MTRPSAAWTVALAGEISLNCGLKSPFTNGLFVPAIFIPLKLSFGVVGLLSESFPRARIYKVLWTRADQSTPRVGNEAPFISSSFTPMPKLILMATDIHCVLLGNMLDRLDGEGLLAEAKPSDRRRVEHRLGCDTLGLHLAGRCLLACRDHDAGHVLGVLGDLLVLENVEVDLEYLLRHDVRIYFVLVVEARLPGRPLSTCPMATPSPLSPVAVELIPFGPIVAISACATPVNGSNPT